MDTIFLDAAIDRRLPTGANCGTSFRPRMLDPGGFRELQHSLQQLMHPAGRRETGLAWVEGPRALIHAVDCRRRIHTVAVCERLLRPIVAQMMVRRLRRAGVNVLAVSPEQFRILSRTPRASGVGLLLHQHWTALDRLRVEAGGCWVAVSRLRSAGNFGTIIRTAQAAGAAGVIVLDPRTDPFDPSVLRGSMGSVLSMTLTRCTLSSLTAWAQRHDIGLVGTSPGGNDLYTVELPRRTAVLFGEERLGLTPAELAACSLSVRIPMVPGTDSINVAVAAGVVLFELRRQSAARMNRNEFARP